MPKPVWERDPKKPYHFLTVQDVQTIAAEIGMLGGHRLMMWNGLVRYMNSFVPPEERRKYSLMARAMFDLNLI